MAVICGTASRWKKLLATIAGWTVGMTHRLASVRDYDKLLALAYPAKYPRAKPLAIWLGQSKLRVSSKNDLITESVDKNVALNSGR